uniref:Uncharacterized protein n=1 Tax=Oryza barthii TaxID=65489 RepID=A0A0D3H5S0_9ORYZ
MNTSSRRPLLHRPPDDVRNMCIALSLTSSVLCNYLSTLLSSSPPHPPGATASHGSLTTSTVASSTTSGCSVLVVLNAVNFVIYLWIANWYRCKRITTTETETQAAA